jgi:nucleoside-diphosphate-sugar epimerase
VTGELTDRRVLVTGAAGFLGATLAGMLCARGAQAHAIVRPTTDPWRVHDLPVAIHRADLCDESGVHGVLAAVRPTDVVHCAAGAGHPVSAEDRAAVWRDNTVATVALLQAMADVRPERFVHVGSATEYRPKSTPLAECDAVEPVTVRGASKLAATVAVRQWARGFSVPSIVMRPFSIYGPLEDERRLVPTVLRCAATGEHFRMLDGVSRRDLVHVDDVADGCVRALAHAHVDAPIVNLGTGVEYTVAEVVSVVESVTGMPVRLADERRPRQRHDVEHWVADTSRCRALLGWVPSTDLQTGIAGLVQPVERSPDPR